MRKIDIKKKYKIKINQNDVNFSNSEIKGLDIDKNEYQEIVLSNSSHPEIIN